ncbi:hypothetical protein C8Q72DRAFT_8856 [Fomitopsis betulina]|nr:hypothetical protein C8Q72DRAFT_8856 [Fomitopsis betulina]
MLVAAGFAAQCAFPIWRAEPQLTDLERGVDHILISYPHPHPRSAFSAAAPAAPAGLSTPRWEPQSQRPGCSPPSSRPLLASSSPGAGGYGILTAASERTGKAAGGAFRTSSASTGGAPSTTTGGNGFPGAAGERTGADGTAHTAAWVTATGGHYFSGAAIERSRTGSAGRSVWAQVQAGRARVHELAQAGPSQPRMQGTLARTPASPPAPVMRMRDPTDKRFFMPLPPTEGRPTGRPSRQGNAPRLQRPLPSRGSSGPCSGMSLVNMSRAMWLTIPVPVVRRPREQPSMVAQARDRILEVAESLGPLSNRAEPTSLSLDISVPDPAEEIVETGGDDVNDDAQVLLHEADRDSGNGADEAEAEDRPDKGKGRATDDEADDARGDFWTVCSGFAAHELLEADPSTLEDTVDAMLKALEERARKHPKVTTPVQDWPTPFIGCSREEMREMRESHLSRAEKLEKIKLMRQQMHYDIECLRAQAEHIHAPELVTHSKRIALQEILQMLAEALKAKLAAQNGDDDGDEVGGARYNDDDSGAGTSGGDGAASGGADSSRTSDSGDGPVDEGADSGDEGGGHDEHCDKASEGHGNGGELPTGSTSSKAAGKRVALPVAVERQATRRMVHSMKKLPSRMTASKTVPAGPAPAWETSDAQASSRSDLESSPSPVVLPPVFTLRQPLRPDTVTPPRRLSAAMKEKARQWLAGFPFDLPSPPSNSPDYSAGQAPSIEPSPVGTARVRLTGVFVLDHSRGLPMLASGPSSTSAARVGGSISERVPNVQRSHVHDDAEGLESAKNEKRTVLVDGAPKRRPVCCVPSRTSSTRRGEICVQDEYSPGLYIASRTPSLRMLRVQ